MRPVEQWVGASRWSCRRPCVVGAASKAEDGKASEVVGSGEQVEVCGDLGSSSHSCSSPAVASSHQVSELALDLGSGGPVVGEPLGVLRLGAGFGQEGFVAAHHRIVRPYCAVVQSDRSGQLAQADSK